VKLSVVILHYQAEPFLKLCLESVKRATGNIPSEIIVADNHSPGFDPAVWTRKYPFARFIRFDKNYGFGKGNNLAVKQAKGQFTVLINPDVVVGEEVFEKLLEQAEKSGNPGIYGIRLIDGSGNLLPESKRNLPGLFNSFAKLSGLHKIFPVKALNTYYNVNLKEDESGPNPVFVGAFMFFPTRTFIDSGGFDERFFMYGEDIDLSKRFWDKGLENKYFGNLIALHFKGESTPDTPEFRQHFIRATELYYEKHAPRMSRLIKPFIRLLFQLKFHAKPKSTAHHHRAQQVYYLGKDRQNVELLRKKFPRIKHIASNEWTSLADGSKIIFNVNEIMFSDIFLKMVRHRHKKFRYRFWLPEEKLIIGSDHPTEKGEIIML